MQLLSGSDFIENIGGNACPDKDKQPHPAFQYIVVLKQTAPGMAYDVMTKNKLKKNSHT
jgi:hypothetical protein